MSSAIFNGSSVKILKDILKFKTGTLIITGQSADPSSVAFDAPQNSIYLQSGTSNIYRKLDTGLSTNWQLIGSTIGAASSTDNAIARFDGITGKVIQNSAVTVDDSGNIVTSGTVDGRDVSTDGSTLDSHLNGGANKHDANEVDYERADGSKKNIQASSDDVEAVVSDLDDAIGALAPTPTNYVPANAAIVASHLAAIDSAIGSAISTINMLEFQDSVISATILTPPGSPTTGDRYLINGVGLVAWTGQDNKIAEWNGSAWAYTTPTTGMFVSSDAESDKLYLYGGASWSAKNFEATTASGFLSKTGFDIQLTNLNSQNVIIGSAGNAATSVDTSSLGDISASTTGGLEIKAGAIVNADINASAAIAVNKLAAVTAQRALVSDASGIITPSSTTDAQIGYLDTLTSNVQSQLNALKPMTTGGDIIYGGASGLPTRLANGTSGQVLTSNGGTTAPSWQLLTLPILTPVVNVITSGTSTYNLPYTFIISSGNATVGATYTHNSVTYTVYATVSSATKVVMSGSAAPLSSGTLTKATGTGDATLTFSQVFSPSMLEVTMVGGGGGGAGSGTAAGTAAGDGGASTFGTTLLSAGGGVKGVWDNDGGAGGSSSLGTGPIGIAISGGRGQGTSRIGTAASSATPPLNGAQGGVSAFGGGGGGGSAGASGAGTAAAANSGSGGGGGYVPSNSNNYGGSGGGSGGYVSAIITSPSATYDYSVGAAGSAGGAGAGGFAGGAGGSGVIIVKASYV